MVNRWALIDENRNEAATPRWLFELLQKLFGEFDLDVAATPANSVCSTFLGDAMAQPWVCSNAYGFPPPHERARKEYLSRAREQVDRGFCKQAIILYAAADPSTRAFRELVQNANDVILVAPRLHLYSIMGGIFEMRAGIAVFNQSADKGRISYLHLPTALEEQGLDYGARVTLFSKVESKQRVTKAISGFSRREQINT